MISSRYIRPNFFAWLFFLGAFATTVGLGTWQVQRLNWKTDLIAQIHAASENTPFTNATLPDDAATLKEKNFWPVKLTGQWQHAREIHIAPRYYHSRLGYHVVQPFTLPDGRMVLVNRGWIPADRKDVKTRAGSMAQGRGTVTGMIRYGSERNPFTPDNQKEKNVWFGRDVAMMAAFYDLKNVLPAMVDVVGVQDEKILPIPSDGTIRLRNDHLSYIITWYGIAAGILVIFVLSHRRKNPA